MVALLGVLIVVILSQNVVESSTSVDFAKVEEFTLFEDQLRELVEYFKMEMPCGFPGAGIPPLAPYEAKFKEFQLKTKAWDIKGNLTDLSITGLNEFDMVVLTFNNVLRKITFDMKFPTILMQNSYMMDVYRKMLQKSIYIFGGGKSMLELTNLRMYGSFKLMPSLWSGTRVTSFKANMEVQNTKSTTTGMMNSHVYSKLFDKWIEEMFRVVFNDSPDEVSAALEAICVPPMNNLLKNVSPKDLVGVILGLAGQLPTEPSC